MRGLSRGARRGAAAVELALVVPILVWLLGAVVDVSAWLRLAGDVRRAARDGAFAAADASDPSGTGTVEATARAAARASLEAMERCGGACAVDATWAPGPAGWTVEVVVEAPFSPIVGVVPGLRSGARARCVALTREQR
jgi:Flp pilus assembly protein TadG